MNLKNIHSFRVVCVFLLGSGACQRQQYLYSFNKTEMYSKTYSADEVINALEVYNQVRSLRKAANITGISKSTIQRWRINLRKVFRRKDKRKRQTKRRHKYPCLEDLIKNLFRLCPADLRRPQNEKRLVFMHLKHIQNALNLSYNIVPSLSLLHRTLKQCKISRRRFNTHHVNL
jgi:transposase